MNFCSACGAPVRGLAARGAFACTGCDARYARAPKIIAGCIVGWNDQILLCRRAIEPAKGTWTFPSGFMENGESADAAARREVFEETGVAITVGELFAIVSTPQVNQVHLVFRARIDAFTAAPGTETSDIALFDLDAIPWSAIAFDAVRVTLQRYVEDRQRGRYGVHDVVSDATGAAVAHRARVADVPATLRPADSPPPWPAERAPTIISSSRRSS
jgi:ADP-ribose pyrophosphatase YjhB (NUDIX family)